METLHSHTEMIDLNPLVEERHPIKAPKNATAEEYHCLWYSITDRVSYLPGGIASGKVTYNACFHDLKWGIQTHCYAPMGLDIRGKWTLGGSLPGEPIGPVELGLGAPLQGLYLREDIDMKCNVLMTAFVKKTTKKAHAALIERLVVKSSKLAAVAAADRSFNQDSMSITKLNTSHSSKVSISLSQASTDYSPSEYEETPISTEAFPQYPESGTILQTQEIARKSSLYPEPLRSGRTSVSSSTGSVQYQGVRHSFEDSLNSHPSQRVSYRSLQPNQQQRPASRSPSPGRQSRAACRPSSQGNRQAAEYRYPKQQPAQHMNFQVQAPDIAYSAVPYPDTALPYPDTAFPSSYNPLPFSQQQRSTQLRQPEFPPYPYPDPALVHAYRSSPRSLQAQFNGGSGEQRAASLPPPSQRVPAPQFGHIELQA